eukprot:3668979-Ditylum_brightwellii.AAC.1
MFTGQYPFQAKGETTLLSPNQLIFELTCKVPLVIAKILLRIMDIGGYNHSHHSARELGNDLYSIITDLESIMSSCYTQVPLGQLEITENKLYGRGSHIMELMSVCQGIGLNGPSKITLISGYSGE